MRGQALIVLLAVMVSGCGGNGDEVELDVFAASSLTEAFTEVGKQFEALHSGVEVAFNFGSSSTVATQVVEGAPADVLATADEETMRRAVDAGRVSDPAVVARNRLELLVGEGNPKGITGLADLDRSGVVFVLCAPVAPCGRLAAVALDRAGVERAPASLEENVKAVAAKVVLGEADAGVVYATDVRAAAARGAEGIAIPEARDPELEAVYFIAALEDSGDADATADFVAFVASPGGQAILERFGFLGR